MEIKEFIENFADQFDETDASVLTPETVFHELEDYSSLVALSIIAMIDEEYGVTLKGCGYHYSGFVQYDSSKVGRMSYNPFSLVGKTILVTGAAGGIGRATSVECAKLGATLILTDINVEGLNETLGMLEGEGHTAEVANLTSQECLDDLVARLPKLDGFVSNAGVTKPMPVKFINKDDMERILSINTLAPVYLTQRLCRKKKLNEGASIVFTISVGGIYTTAPGNAMYGASKGALQVFMKNVALEMAPKVRCNSVNPGMVNTKLAGRSYSEEDMLKDMQTYPLKRYGEPQDVALAIVYLLSDASAWVTGHSLIIDGGKTLY